MRIQAKELRERFGKLNQLKDDVPGDHLRGFPPQTIEEKRLSELFCIVSDIIIWIEQQEEKGEKQ